MASFFDQLTPQQKTALAVAVPVVAVAAIISKRGGAAPAASSGAPSVTYQAPAASTDAIGVGQLGAFEDQIAGQLQDLATVIDSLVNGSTGSSGPPPANNSTIVLKVAEPNVGESAAQVAARLTGEGRTMTMGNNAGQPPFAAYLLFVNSLGAQYQDSSPLPIGRRLIY